MGNKENDPKVELPISTLRAIANYYEFPIAVFFLPENKLAEMKETTRWKELLKENEKLETIKDAIAEATKEAD